MLVMFTWKITLLEKCSILGLHKGTYRKQNIRFDLLVCWIKKKTERKENLPLCQCALRPLELLCHHRVAGLSSY